jgi:hypothetical protein
MTKIFMAVIVACAALSANAFPINKATTSPLTRVSPSAARPTSSALSERQWNFNEGQAPWGLKKNAEKWNGRVAQVRNESNG